MLAIGCAGQFIEYWEIGRTMSKHFSWVTNLRVSQRNVYQLMRVVGEVED